MSLLNVSTLDARLLWTELDDDSSGFIDFAIFEEKMGEVNPDIHDASRDKYGALGMYSRSNSEDESKSETYSSQGSEPQGGNEYSDVSREDEVSRERAIDVPTANGDNRDDRGKGEDDGDKGEGDGGRVT